MSPCHYLWVDGPSDKVLLPYKISWIPLFHPEHGTAKSAPGKYPYEVSQQCDCFRSKGMVNKGVSDTPRTPYTRTVQMPLNHGTLLSLQDFHRENSIAIPILQKRRNTTQPWAPGLEPAEILHHEILGLKSTISLQHCSKQPSSCLVCPGSISCNDNRCSLVQGGMLDRRGPGRSCLLLRQQFQWWLSYEPYQPQTRVY